MPTAKQRWIIEPDYQETETGTGAWAILKNGAGAVSTTTPPSALPPMGSCWRSETVFPPLPAPVILNYQPPHSRRTSARAGRLRPERHNPYSMTTLRIQLAYYLLRQLFGCPFCGSAAAGHL